MSTQPNLGRFEDLRNVLGIQIQTVMDALDAALAGQPSDERNKLLMRLGRAMSRHIYSWEEAIKTDSLEELADALENALE